MNEEKKEIDNNLQQALKADNPKTGLSSNFTHLVMQKVEATELKKSAGQKPLVGILGWIIFAVFTTLVILPLILKGGSSFEISLPNINMEKFWSTYSLIPLILLAASILIFADTLMRKRNKKAE